METHAWKFYRSCCRSVSFALSLPQSMSRTADTHTTPQPVHPPTPEQNTYFLLVKNFKCIMEKLLCRNWTIQLASSFKDRVINPLSPVQYFLSFQLWDTHFHSPVPFSRFYSWITASCWYHWQISIRQTQQGNFLLFSSWFESPLPLSSLTGWPKTKICNRSFTELKYHTSTNL